MPHTGGPPHGPVPVPDTSGFTGSILGWTWLGRWAEAAATAGNIPPEVVTWLNGWATQWEAAANATLTGEITDALKLLYKNS